MLTPCRLFLTIACAVLLLVGCGGGGGASSGGGGTPPVLVSLGGKDFDPAQSASFAWFTASTPGLTLYYQGPGITVTNRMRFVYVYSALIVGGVPAVNVEKTRLDPSPADPTVFTVGMVVNTAFAKATDGGIYIIKSSRAHLPADPTFTWTAGSGGAVPSRFILPTPATSGTYLGGYRQQYSPSTPGGSETMSTPSLDAATPSGLFNHTLQVLGYDGGEFLRVGDGIVEIDESGVAVPAQPAGTTGWKATLPVGG